MNIEDVYSISHSQLRILMQILTNGKQKDFFRDVFIASNLPRCEWLRQGMLEPDKDSCPEENFIFCTHSFQYRHFEDHINSCQQIGRIARPEIVNQDERSVLLFRTDELKKEITGFAHQETKHAKAAYAKRMEEAIKFKLLAMPVNDINDIKYLLPDRRLWNIYHFHSDIFLYSGHSIAATQDFQWERDYSASRRWDFK